MDGGIDEGFGAMPQSEGLPDVIRDEGLSVRVD